MKICVHIAYYFKKERLKYVKRVLEEINKYPHDVDIFIHTTEKIPIESSKNLKILIHKTFKDNNPYYLTWKCRLLLESQIDKYDIFIYLEDDIILYKETLNYWLKYKDWCIKRRLNLGFLRIEKSPLDGKNHWVDSGGKRLVNFPKKEYAVVNTVQEYCAFWIYDRNEMKRWILSDYWDPSKVNKIHSVRPWRNLSKNHIRERSSVGMTYDGYRGTIIPLINGKVHPNCVVYHQGERFTSDPKIHETTKLKEIFII